MRLRIGWWGWGGGWRNGASGRPAGGTQMRLRGWWPMVREMASLFRSSGVAVHDIRYRLLRERLKQIAAATERMHDEDGVRLGLWCLALLDWHQVDKKGWPVLPDAARMATVVTAVHGGTGGGVLS